MWLAAKVFIDNRTDIQAFGHADIVSVFNHCHGFAYAEAFGSQTGQNVGFGIFSQCCKCLCLANAFFFEQGKVASVAMNNECMAVLDQFVQSFGSFGIRLYDLGVHIVGHGVDQVYCRTTPSITKMFDTSG